MGAHEDRMTRLQEAEKRCSDLCDELEGADERVEELEKALGTAAEVLSQAGGVLLSKGCSQVGQFTASHAERAKATLASEGAKGLRMTDTGLERGPADQWFEVRATVKVKHANAHDAEMYVVGLLGSKPRLYPVGVLHAEPCEDPTVRIKP